MHSGEVVSSSSKVLRIKEKRMNSQFSFNDSMILLTFDKNYIEQSKNLIMSVMKHNSLAISFVCFCVGLNDDDKEALLNMNVGISIYDIEILQEINTGRWSICTILRVFAPWICDEKICRVLYLDSDILCTGNLDELFEVKVSYIGMCNEISGNVSETQQKFFRRAYPVQIYYNAGVTILNLQEIRKAHTFDEVYGACVDICNTYPFMDQDFLNIFFRGRIMPINGFHYNFQPHELRKTPLYRKALKNCKLIHFSVGKPWKYQSSIQLILLYLKHSAYSPMIKRIRKTVALNLLYSPCKVIQFALTKAKICAGLLSNFRS